MPSLEFRRVRSEEHTSELQSHSHLVCRLLLEKKKETSATQTRPCTIPEVTQHSHASRDDTQPVPRPPRPVVPPSRHCGSLLSFFFFKGWGAPRVLPFSPTRPSPD